MKKPSAYCTEMWKHYLNRLLARCMQRVFLHRAIDPQIRWQFVSENSWAAFYLYQIISDRMMPWTLPIGPVTVTQAGGCSPQTLEWPLNTEGVESDLVKLLLLVVTLDYDNLVFGAEKRFEHVGVSQAVNDLSRCECLVKFSVAHAGTEY